MMIFMFCFRLSKLLNGDPSVTVQADGPFPSFNQEFSKGIPWMGIIWFVERLGTSYFCIRGLALSTLDLHIAVI